MNILLLDEENFALDFAYRCAEAGHAVRWYRKDRTTHEGDGFPGIESVLSWNDHMKWAKDGLVITTFNKQFIKELDRYREYGFPIFSPSSASAQLEINRKTGMDLMAKRGMNIAPYKMFDSLKDAIAHVVKTDQIYVFKTMGDEEDKSLSYVGCSPEDLVAWLQGKMADGLKLKGPCMLQEKIDMVCEVGIAAWIGPAGFIPKWEISFEHKKLMPGNFGPNTGEMGTVTKYVHTDPLVDILKSFEADLVKMQHTTDIAINGGIDAKGQYWPFEWTARLGWPDFFNRVAMQTGDPAQWMRDLTLGKDTLKVSSDVVISVLVTQPPFPNKPTKEQQAKLVGNTVDGLKQIWPHVHPIGLMIGQGPKIEGGTLGTQDAMQTTGEYALVVTGAGKTVAKARDDVYRSVGQIKLANAIVRDDIGESLEKSLPTLHALGHCKEVAYL